MSKKSIFTFFFIPFILFVTTKFYWTKAKDSLELSYKVLNQINQLNLTDPKIDRLMLAKRDYINYDYLVQYVKSFNQTLKSLKNNMIKNDKNLFNSSEHIIKLIEIEFSRKNEYIEDFKSKHAVLQNSLRFIIELYRDKNRLNKIGDNHIKELFSEFITTIALMSSWKDFNSNDISNLLEKIGSALKIDKSQNIVFYLNIHLKNIKTLSQDISIIENELEKKRVSHQISVLKSHLITEFAENRETQNRIFYMLVGFLAFFLILLIIFHFKDKELEKKLIELNAQLNNRIRVAVNENREKDKMMFQQSKLASMGEMIGNIAHQWRQPLNSISILIQDYESAYEFDELDGEYLEKSRIESMEQINYMSKTIDDFRNFFTNSEKIEVFTLQDVINDSIGILKASFKSDGIEFFTNLGTDTDLNGVKSQYMQVLINLLKNAKDVLIEKNIQKAQIMISTSIENNQSTLSVKDNGGGVPNQIKEKIFEPYFTTKHQSIGTGIGLYMSKIIIEDSFKGSLTVENVDDGADFRIKTPIYNIEN